MLLALHPENLDPDGASLLARYLEGKPISAGKLQRAGIRGVKNPLSRRNAEHALNTALMTLYALGVPGTLIAFDETERSLVSRSMHPSTRVLTAANLVRRMIDACPTGRVFGALVVFAVLPDFIERSARVYPALGQRLRTRVTEGQASWRSPVLSIDDVSLHGTQEDFLCAAASRFGMIPHDLTPDRRRNLSKELLTAGQEVLAEHAGAGYRRPLVKRLASITLRHMEDEE